MSHFDFTGDLEFVRECQLDFISRILEREGFKGPNASIQNVGEVGDNYMGNIKRVVVTENGKTFKMIAKLAPDSELIRQMLHVDVLYQNENIIYTQLLPKMVELQRNAGIPENYLFRHAKCYGCLNEIPNEVILLVDLKEMHYSILDRLKPLSKQNVKLVLKNFAIFHSLSFALKYAEPETYEEIKSKFVDNYDAFELQDDMIQYIKQMEISVLSIVTDDKYKKHVTGSISEILNLHSEVKKENEGSKYLVIQQGDGWTNNIMFKYEANEPVSCMLIDYQMARENSPVYDIMYMLFNSTDHEQRLKYYHEFMDYYYQELDKSLSYLGMKSSIVYPRGIFDNDLRRYGKLMFATSIMVSSFILKNTENATEMKEIINTQTASDYDAQEMIKNVSKIHSEFESIFKARIEGLIDSCVEFGLF